MKKAPTLSEKADAEEIGKREFVFEKEFSTDFGFGPFLRGLLNGKISPEDRINFKIERQANKIDSDYIHIVGEKIRTSYVSSTGRKGSIPEEEKSSLLKYAKFYRPKNISKKPSQPGKLNSFMNNFL